MSKMTIKQLWHSICYSFKQFKLKMTDQNNSEQLPIVEPEEAAAQIVNNALEEETMGQLPVEDRLKEAEEKYLRLYADFENYKRRTSREYLEMRMTAGKEIMTALVPVLDDFYRARKQLESATDIASVKEGVELIFNKLKLTLENKGLQIMDSVGQPFDAEKHEAITEIPSPTEDMKGKVVDEVEKGYLLNDKILRYAKVVVGK